MHVKSPALMMQRGRLRRSVRVVSTFASPGPYVVGLDLAKSVFQLHVATPDGVCVARERLARADLLPYFKALPMSVVAMEACAGAHYWAAAIRGCGHAVRLLHALTVSRIRKEQKTDRNDAATICLVARLPDIRSVPWKSPEQQAVLALHGMRQLVQTHKIASANQILSYLAEFGNVTWRSRSALLAASEEEVNSSLASVPAAAAIGIRQLLSRIRYYVGQEFAMDLQITRWHEGNKNSQLVASIPRLGVLSATAIVATLGSDFDIFKSGRDVSAWLGLVPMQHSSGMHVRIGHINPGGDQYMRQLLYNVATASLMYVYKMHSGPRFLVRMLENRKPQRVIAIAFANKIVRTAWTMLKQAKPFEVRRDWEHIPFPGKPPKASVGKDESLH